jgi:hypothetical protein
VFERDITVIGNVVEEFFGVLGVGDAVLAVGFGFDFGGRKNELFGDWFGVLFVWFAFHFLEVALGYGGVELGLAGGSALGLEFLELSEGFFERTLQPLFVKTQVDEGFGVFAEDSGSGQGGVDLRMACVYVARGFEVTEREHAVFDRAGAVETPLGVAEGLGVLALERGFGREIGHEFFAESVVSVEVFVREDNYASGQAVTESVERGGFFAFGRAGSGGFGLCVGWRWGHWDGFSWLWISRWFGCRAREWGVCGWI